MEKTSSYRIKKFFVRQQPGYWQLCPGRCPVWQASFHDFNIDSDGKLREKLEYMHQNPVAANLAQTSLGWNWSSASFYENGERVGITITPSF